MNTRLSSNWWETPELTQINRLPMTSCLVPFATHAEALAYQKQGSPWYQSLNGTWRFKRFARPEDVASEILTGDQEGVGFRDMPVPANWTLQDTEDKPIYTNVQMPFDNTPPVVPEENPTAVYRLSFDVPQEWSGRRVIIHLGGVESYYELFVNGEFAGMAKDTRLPSEFDITDLVKPGQNRLAAKVIRWSDASYIEDQDQWWMAGIYRDVYLYSTEPAHLEDLFVRGDYDAETRTGQLDIDATFGYVPVSEDDPNLHSGPINDYAIKVALFDASGFKAWESAARVDPSYRKSQYQEHFCTELPGIEAWSSESPTLYRLVATLTDCEGREIEHRCVRVGFRRVEITNRELQINGQPVLIKGVNRHEHDQLTGKVMTRELMLKDITLLKQFNFNAVRTSHYPDTMEWYDLCDEYGIYLVDEANIEAHDNYDSICRDPRWGRAFLERITNMVLRDKNHPSIIGWSAGNETGHGANHTNALDRVREMDPTRFIHHEGEVKGRWSQGGNVFTGGDNRYNDVVNPMYPTIEAIIQYADEGKDPRPVILCEYSHAMGNSNGSLAEYWDAFERYHGLQGGFIWEWVDHGIVQTDPKGREYWAYGGDFGEEIHDGNFVADGLVAPDRTPHPGMWEFKKVAQPVAVTASSVTEGRFTITSKADFTSLKWLSGSWEVRVEGVVTESGSLPPLDIPAGGSLEIDLAYKDPAALAQPEAYVHFSFVTREQTPWCDSGHEVAWEQVRANPLPLPTPAVSGAAPGGSDDATATTQNGGASLTSGDLTISVASANGTTPVAEMPSISVALAGELVIPAGPRLNAFRATTDNDGIRGWDGQEFKPMGLWLSAGFDKLTHLERTIGTDDGLTFTDRFHGTDESLVITHTQTIRACGDQMIRIDNAIDYPDGLPTLPRVGVIMQTVPGYEQLTWYGRGPLENHIDRKEGYPVGRYSGSVADQYVPYIMPQENGSKCETRWFELTNGSGSIRFIADPTFEFSVHHFTPEDLFAGRHTPDVEDVLRPETVISIDHIQRGVGTGSCGPQTREHFCIDPGCYEFGYWMELR